MRGLLCLLSVSLLSAGDSILYTRFQSGEASLWDIVTGKKLSSVAVEDGAGITGIEGRGPNGEIYIIDGNTSYKVRVFESSFKRMLQELAFPFRRLSYGGPPVTFLAANSRWLLVSTYELASAAEGIRIFNTRTGNFEPGGLRYRKCPSPVFAATNSNVLAVICPGSVSFTEDPGNFPGVERATSATGVVTAVMHPDGGSVFILDSSRRLHQVFNTNQPEKLMSWTSIPSLGKDGSPPPFDVNQTASRFSIVSNGTALIIDAVSGRLIHSTAVSGDCSGSRFLSDGISVVTVCGTADKVSAIQFGSPSNKLKSFTIENRPASKPFSWRLLRQ